MTSILRWLPTKWRRLIEGDGLTLAEAAEVDKYMVKEQGLCGDRKCESRERPVWNSLSMRKWLSVQKSSLVVWLTSGIHKRLWTCLGWERMKKYTLNTRDIVAHPVHPEASKCVSMPIHPFFSQFSSVTQSCLTLCNPMDRSTPGLSVHHQFPEFIQTHVHWVGDAIQPSHPLSSRSPPAFNLSQHKGLFRWVSCLHQVAKVLEFQLQHQSFQWTPRTDLL